MQPRYDSLLDFRKGTSVRAWKQVHTAPVTTAGVELNTCGTGSDVLFKLSSVEIRETYNRMRSCSVCVTRSPGREQSQNTLALQRLRVIG